jgi:hypothetical protein
MCCSAEYRVVKNTMKIEKKIIALCAFALTICLVISAIAYTTAQTPTGDDTVPEEQPITTFDDNTTETEVSVETELPLLDPSERWIIAPREDGQMTIMTLREYYAIYGDNTPMPGCKMYYETEDGTLVDYHPFKEPPTHDEDGNEIKYKPDMKQFCIIGDRVFELK